MQKSRDALADALKSIRKRIENKQWAHCSSFMLKTWFYSLVPFFWFFCFLIRNFNSFCSSFYYCNWPENSHHHAYSRHHSNKEWLIFPTTMLIPGTMLIKSGSSFPPPHLFQATRLFGRGKSNNLNDNGKEQLMKLTKKKMLCVIILWIKILMM